MDTTGTLATSTAVISAAAGTSAAQPVNTVSSAISTNTVAITGSSAASNVPSTAAAGGSGGGGIVVVTATEIVTNAVTGTNSLGQTTTGQAVEEVTVIVTAGGDMPTSTIASQPDGK